MVQLQLNIVLKNNKLTTELNQFRREDALEVEIEMAKIAESVLLSSFLAAARQDKRVRVRTRRVKPIKETT